MKIVLNSQSDDLLNEFLRLSKNNNVEIINAKTEKFLFDCISVGDVSAFIIDNSSEYSQKAIDFIKKKHPYIPVVIIGKQEIDKINNADIYIPLIKDVPYFYSLLTRNIINYEKNFKSLQRLTIKISNKIEFGDCMYDPNIRTLFYQGREINKFSEKAGGIVEILAANYGKLVRKELILEKIWLKSDYFSSRSMDVYVTNIRKILAEHKISMKIKSVSKSGLILE